MTFDVKELALKACRAAMAYNDAVLQRADDGQFEMNVGKAWAAGHDLDALYARWIVSAHAALVASGEIDNPMTEMMLHLADAAKAYSAEHHDVIEGDH